MTRALIEELHAPHAVRLHRGVSGAADAGSTIPLKGNGGSSLPPPHLAAGKRTPLRNPLLLLQTLCSLPACQHVALDRGLSHHLWCATTAQYIH